MRSIDGGLTLLRKPAGITSFRILGSLKRALGTKKVGHAGTLDQFATGLLVVLSGRATKLVRFVTGLDKRYEAVFRFGVQTDTLDPQGRPVEECSPPHIDQLKAAASQFTGTFEQTPPQYSAVHVEGRRAYQVARRGAVVDIPPRTVRISDLAIGDFDGWDLQVSLSCSSGTYVRSLARDLGHAVGSCAHVLVLNRLSVGPFELADAVGPEEFDPNAHVLAFEDFVPGLPGVVVTRISDEGRAEMLAGRRVTEGMLSPADGTYLAVFDSGGRFLGILEYGAGRYRYLFNRGAAD